MMLLSKVTPQSLRSLAGDLKIKVWSCHRNLAAVFAVWSGVTYAITCFIKWSKKTKMFTMFGGWSNSIIVSMLVKSMWSNTNGAVTMIGHIAALAWVPSCWMHLSLLLIAFCIWAAMPGHQSLPYSKHSVHCWPWCQASLWHPFMLVTQWALGTKNCRTSSNSPVGVWWWYRAP